MPLTRLDNLISSKTGKYLYVSPDDFNATDSLSNRGNSPVTPFKSIQRAFLEVARYSYLPGFGNDRFDQFSIMLMPGIHYIDNRPGLIDTTGITEFPFDQTTNAWGSDPILDISSPDNILYKFNNTEGGAIIPRGSSLVGYDLRRTTIRPLYVPDPATTENEIPRSAIFNVTGGCYFWQFTIKDGQTTSESPLFDNVEGTGKVYYDPNDFTKLAAPNYSHHKLTVFEYADKEELALFYRKIAKAFAGYQPTIDDPGEFDFNIQENRIVGPLSDSRVIESLKLTDATTDSSIAASTTEVEVTTKVDHGYFQGQFVAIANTTVDDVLEGIFPVKEIDQNDPRKFTYEVPFVVSAIGSGNSSGDIITQPTLGANAQTLAEVDSVESASPYVFNVSIRSTWGICGIWANGLKATGFKSMVIAQYTGVSLQKDDRAFIRYDEYSNTWNQASLVDAFATVPYHTKGDSYWKDEWRNFHVRASEDAFIQNVSIFAVGFADHFLMESGGDMSITNSNSNFGNTSLHAIGFKGFAFNQDKGGYLTHIIPPKQVKDTAAQTKKVAYYTIDIQGTLQQSGNYTKLYLGSDDIVQPTDRPAATIDGFRIGAKSNEKLYVKLDPAPGTDEFFEAALEPTGFVKYLAKGDILNPTGGVINSVYADAANLIESNRRMIQEEVFGYILQKYPRLQNISYVNPGLNPAGNRYFDARNLILANRQEIVNTAFDQMVETFGISNIQGVADGKCKRDIGFIVDAIAEDLKDGGNANIIDATKFYFDGAGAPINNGLVGEEEQSIFAFNRARDLCKKAIANLLTVKADIYDPDPNSILFNGNTNKYPDFIAGKGYTGSAAEEASLTDNGVTYDTAGLADPAGRYKDARNRIVANRDFILDAALAEVAVYHPDFYIPGDTQSNDQSRYADAFRLIRRNSKEIGDKALAAIALNHPGFYIPGDQQTDETSRYADAYRLIQQNRDQIVDTGLAQIAIGHPDFYIPGDPATDERSRYADGYRLIQQNKTEIVNTAYANMLAIYPNYDGNGGNTFGDKCKRDIGYLVDAVSLDLFVGGNKYSRKFISEYFDATGQNWISGGLQGEETASIEAFNQAKDLMGAAVANQLSISDPTVSEGPAQYGGGGGNVSRTNAAACDDVQSAIDTLVAIITGPINAGNLSGLPAETSYIAGPGETKCRRDIGYFVDALALDLFIDGNEYTWKFCAEYFENATTQISDGLVGEEGPSRTAFAKAADMMKQAVANQLYEKDLSVTADPSPGDPYGTAGSNTDNQFNTALCSDVQAAIDTLGGIVDTVFLDGNLSSMPTEINKGSAGPGETKCRRDIGYFIDAISVDMFTGGNKHTKTFTRQYFDAAGTTPISNGLVGEVTQSVTAFNTAIAEMKKAVYNALYYKDLTVTEGDSEYGINPADGPIDRQSSAACSDVQAAIDTLGNIAVSAINNGNVIGGVWNDADNAGSFLTGETKCRRDIGHVVDAIAQDIWFGGNEYTIAATKEYFNSNSLISNGVDNEVGPSITAFKRAADLMNRAANNQYYDRDLTITLDQTEDPAFVSDIHADAYNLVLDNKEFIAAEAYERMLAAYPSYQPQQNNTKQDCLDDVYDVLEEVMWDVKFGGNSKTYDAANVYVTNTFNGQVVETFIDAERDEAAKVFTEVKNIAIQVIRNETVSVSAGNTLTQKKDLTIVDDWDIDELLPTCGSAVAATDTLLDIVIQAIGTDSGVGNLSGVTRTAPTQPTTYTVGNCSDVLQTIDTLTGILCDALLAGNLNDLPPVSNGQWDCANVRSTIENLFDILTDAISGGTLAGLPPVNKGDFTINNEASKCFRDVSYIVDAVVNDLRLGGNINSIQAGEAYYVGNSLTYIDGERQETTDAWDYVGQLATAAMRNFDVLASGCTVTTGSNIVDVGDTRGIVIGMSVKEYDNTNVNEPAYRYGLLQTEEVQLRRDEDATPYALTQVVSRIPADTYVKKILGPTTIELGTFGSALDEGTPVSVPVPQGDPPGATINVDLYFEYNQGIWADTLPTTVTVGGSGDDVTPEVLVDTLTSTSYRECSGTADAIEVLIGNITTIIDSGLGSVTRQEQTVDTAALAARATVFTIDTTGTGPSNPHNFETGTPVRLVPRPRFDVDTGKYVDVDKRLVRLPNGFETNRTYYVIAPGRSTEAGGEEYNGTSFFDGSDQTKLMLATSKENAAAGIYIYASETDAIDKDVEIDLYQFVLDDKYDLHNYTAVTANGTELQTDVAHIFDVPDAGVTPQLVFIRESEGGQLPQTGGDSATDPAVTITDSNDANYGRVNPNAEFYARYASPKKITLHKTHADAINGVGEINFVVTQNEFQIYANKRRSPMRFDPTFTNTTVSTGKWYIQCKDNGSSSNTDSVRKNDIFWRINESDYADRQRSTDMWYERLDDTREADERTYKLRLVIPKYLENARDPINGFVLKTRTDDTRKLVPQKILLKPVTGSVYGARFENPVQAGEFIGVTKEDAQTANLSLDAQYDPYLAADRRAYARFNSGVQATIQSGRYVEDALDASIKYLELTVYDHTIDTINFSGLSNEILTTVKITAPQGGSFITNKTQNGAGDTNAATFSGNSSGQCNIHGYFNVGGDHYLIIKNIRGGILEYSEYTTTTFRQGNVFADMLEDQDMGKSLPLKTLIRKNYPEYYYKQNGANVYTITPGDRIQDSAGIEYYVASVEDAGVIEDTFYIFGYETLQRRIAGQQDGIYYVTALRGNISPFPTGAGVINNFKKFKFSQPVSKLYPLNYRNDPLWFKNSGTTQAEKDYYANLIDPPQAYSAADNYIHGLVTVNDYKNSVTRELVEDLLSNPAFILNTYTGDNQIRAKDGNAVSGSEDRLIPIAGDSTVLSDQRYYVELRRPSIARAGNHTFEYLGFGPGNYSTGLPARQEIVLTPDEDFYAQSKKQDGGIVFYTGINSQGDLYIGNRRINAITGEETFIDRATLNDDGDEDDVIGGLVTTFDTPVTFNQNITVVGGDGTLVNNFESPVVIAVQDGDFTQVDQPLIIRSYVKSTENDLGVIEQDERLDNTEFNPPNAGDIKIGKNRVKAAVFEITPIRYPRARGYKFLTHAIGAFGSNLTPNQSPLYSAGGTRILADQYITYGGVVPSPGDVLIKGKEVNLTGSFAWVLADGYTTIADATLDDIVFNGSNIFKITFNNTTNDGLGITLASQIRVSDYYPNSVVNGTWYVVNPGGVDAFAGSNDFVHVQLIDAVSTEVKPWADVIANAAAGVEPKIEFSNSTWKEVGVIGAETLRTETATIGDYKLGINTVARAPHSAAENAWTSIETDPRANLDVVGTAFISGRTTADFLDHTNFADRDKTAVDNALLVGGDSAAPNDEAVLRVATTNGGRVGINVDNSQLDRALVVDGTSRFTDDARFEHDIEVNGDDGVIAEIRTSQTSGTFNLVTDTTFEGRLNLAGNVEDIRIGNDRTGDTYFRLGNASDHSNIFIGDIDDSENKISKIQIGGAYNNNSSNSYTLVGTKQFSVAGDMLIGANKTIGGDATDPTQTVTLRSEAGVVNFFTTQTQTLNFATNASLITIGGQGGSTTVRNNFIVDANSRFNADIKLCGGNASYSFEGLRAQLGTDDFAHASGILGQDTFNSNIDIINVSVITVADGNAPTTAELAAGFNRIDTAGAATWGDATFQESKTGAGAEGSDLPAITGDEFYLPMKYAPTPYFQAGDYILIDTVPTGSGATERYPELVRITEDGLAGAGAAPYYIKVKRHPLGSFTKYKLQQLSPAQDYLSTHLDATNLWKANISFDATWTTQVVDATGPVDNFYLSQFGGSLTTNDYVIVDREDTNDDGDFNQGEIVKVQTQLDQVSKKLIVTSGCDSANEKDVFVVDSVTGDITIGDETVQNSVLDIYGSLKLSGGCGSTPIVNNIYDIFEDTSDNSKLTLTNRDFTTFEVDTCQGNTIIGNEWGWVWALQGYYSSTAVAHSVTEPVYVYTRDPQTAQATGPETLLASTLSAGQTQFMVVNSITGFEKGDLVAIINGATQAEIIRITDDPYVDSSSNEPRIPFNTTIDYPSGGRAQETTTAQSFTVGAVVVKIQKDSRSTTLLEALPATGRTQAPTPNTNPDRIVLKLANGNLVSQKLDYEQFIRIGSEFFFPDSIDGTVDPNFGVKMPKSIRDTNDSSQPEKGVRRYFGGGKLTINDDLNINAGNFRMYGTDSKTLILGIANDDGHPGDGAILDPVTNRAGMYLNGRADIYGKLRVYQQTCQENGTCSNDLMFDVDNSDGSVRLGESLYIKGQILESSSSASEVLHIDNLGSAGNTGAGPNDFIMYQDGSIDAFGIRRYFNANGGRRWTYLAASTTGFGQVVSNPLTPNGNYLVNPSSSGNMVVYLPSDAKTGDMIRFIDISSNLSYAASLIIRALPIGTTAVAIQGDTTGTKAQAGSAGPSALAWSSGEMIVQTRNASFGLVYVGVSDAEGDPDASEIPTDLRGWWLVEL